MEEGREIPHIMNYWNYDDSCIVTLPQCESWSSTFVEKSIHTFIA